MRVPNQGWRVEGGRLGVRGRRVRDWGSGSGFAARLVNNHAGELVLEDLAARA